jgi:hypothetical protein
MSEEYNLSNIHQLLVNAYDEEDLRRLIEHHFKEASPKLANLYGKSKLADLLIEHCANTLSFDKLLGLVAEQRLERYWHHGPYKTTPSDDDPPVLPTKVEPGFKVIEWGINRQGCFYRSMVPLTILLMLFVPALFLTDYIFNPPQPNYTLSTSTLGEGQVLIEPEQDSYPAGSIVTLTAIPNEGAFFAGWQGAFNQADNPLNIIITRDVALTATFTSERPTTHNLSLSILGQGRVWPSSSSHISGTVVNLLAQPEPGWAFQAWGGAVSSTLTSTTLLMDAPKTLRATFIQSPSHFTIFLPVMLK